MHWHRKDLAALRQHAHEASPFQRTLGVWELSALGIGYVVGSGIFVLTGHIAAESAGPAVVLAFLLAAVPASLVAMCYAEMAATVPGGGGAYLYTAASLGRLPAFLVGWTLTFTYCIGAATVAGGWSSYAVDALGQLGIALPHELIATPDAGGWADLPAAFIVLLLSGVLLLGASASMHFTTVLVAVKIAVVLIFVVTVGQHVNTALWHPFIPPDLGWSGIWKGASLAVFAYVGVDNIATAVQETKNPERDVPVAIAVTMIVAVVLYCAACLVLTGAVPYQKLNVDDALGFATALVTSNQTLDAVVQGGALTGLTCVLLIQLYGLPRILYAMAEDGLAPKWAHKLGHRHATPTATTMAMGAVCALAAAVTPVETLAAVTAAGTLTTFVCVSLGVAVLRREHPRMHRHFRIPGGTYWVPGAAALSCTALFLSAPKTTLITLACWWILGLVVYWRVTKHQA